MGQKMSLFKCKTKSKKKKQRVIQTYYSGPYEGPPGSYMVKAKYKYTATSDADISFEENEIMYVIKEFNNYWYLVIKHNDKTEGLIPSNYVSIQDGSPQSSDAWRDIQRWEAEKLLMRVGIKRGTYIIRPSRTEKCFALSVLDFDEKKKISFVKNFQIKTMFDTEGNVSGYSINIKRFENIIALVQHYEKFGIGNTHIQLTNSLLDNYQPPVHFQDFEVNRDNIKILSQIGSGCFGSVHKARWGRSYEVAVKMMQSIKSDKAKFMHEAKIMHELRHRRIVELLGVCTEPQDLPMLIIVEYMKNGSLREYLKSEQGKTVSLNQMIQIMAEISEGMTYLEKENFVHRDLRADNILIAEDLSAKVADFGLTELSNDAQEGPEQKKVRFPYKWTSPEAAKTKVFTSKSDVWSFGIVMYEIVTWARTPYPDIPAKEVIEKVSEGYRMQNPENIIPGVICPPVIYDIMCKCWNHDPNERPSFLSLQEQMDQLIVNKNNYYSQSK